MNLLIVGRGRMGALIEALAPSYDFHVSGVLDVDENPDGRGLTAERCRGVDVAIEFTMPSSVMDNVRALTAAGINAVVGTTGWRAHEALARTLVAEAGTGVVVASNFSLGANVQEAVTAYMTTLFRGRTDYGAWIHEAHHSAKKDAPSGTALTLADALKSSDPARVVDMSSTRAGHNPGVHTVGYDGPAEQISVTHLVRDRAAFAHGALAAARWVVGRRGWFTMRDVLGLGDAN